MQRVYRHGRRHVAVGVQRIDPGHFTVAVDGQRHEVEARAADATTLRLTTAGTSYTARVARVGDALHVAIDGEVHVFVPEVAGAAGDTGGGLAAPQIVAPMPGKVLHVLVQVGQQVGDGDGLLILEAMKMEHRMVAEAPATVQAVHVVDGQMVDAGTVLVELDYAPPP